jgi:uncharacterized lipoprotein YddW (UPF0748 family)
MNLMHRRCGNPCASLLAVVATVCLVALFGTGCARVGVDGTPGPAGTAGQAPVPPPAEPPVAPPTAPPTPPTTSTPPPPTPPTIPPQVAPVPTAQGIDRTGAAISHPLDPPQGVRALWVVRTALVHPDSARRVVSRAHEAGYNTLLVQVRGRGDAWYRSSLEPRAIQLPPGNPMAPGTFDPLGTILEAALPLGIQVHAWVNAHLVGSALLPPSDPAHLALRNPEWLAVPRELAPRLESMSPRDPRYLQTLLEWSRANGERVEGLFTNPGNPQVQAHLEQVVAELLDHYPGLHGIHLDYIRFGSPDFDYSPEAVRRFRGWLLDQEVVSPAAIARAENGGAPQSRNGSSRATALPDAFPTEWDAFRREQVSSSVARVSRFVRSQRDGQVLLSASVFANADDAWRSRFQPWEEWIRDGLLDVVVPMAYTASDEIFEAQIRRAVAAGGANRVWAGIGIYQNTLPSAIGKGRLAQSLGVGGLALFSYDWAVGPEGARVAPSGYLSQFQNGVWGPPNPSR